jgi:hypothetical protein
MSIREWLPRIRAKRTAELSAEMRLHIEMATADRIARGESPVEAAANARLEFGNPGLATESLAKASEPQVYASVYQRAEKHLAIFVQGGAEPAPLEQQVRDVVQSINPTLPVFGAETLSATVAASVAMRRLSLELIALFAAIALLLSAIGIYGVVSFIVGATVGLVGAVLVSRVLAGLLDGVRSLDPPTLAASAALLTAVAAAGCYFPARRAVQIEPVVALRV